MVLFRRQTRLTMSWFSFSDRSTNNTEVVKMAPIHTDYKRMCGSKLEFQVPNITEVACDLQKLKYLVLLGLAKYEQKKASSQPFSEIHDVIYTMLSMGHGVMGGCWSCIVKLFLPAASAAAGLHLTFSIIQ